MNILRCAAIAASVLFAHCAAAQALSPEDFAKHPEVSEAAISPTGEYLALASLTPDGRETQLKILKLDGSKAVTISIGRYQHITDIVWTDDTRVVVSRAEKELGEERPRSTGELYAVDADGKNQEMLFGYVPEIDGKRGRRQDQGFAAIARVLDEPGQVLVSYYSYTQGSNPQSVIFKVDTHTGERKEVERVKRAAGMAFDRSGRLRVLVTLDDEDRPQMFYRQTAASELQPMPGKLVGYRSYGGWFAADGNLAYLWISDDGEPSQLYKVDFSKGTREKVAGKTDQDVGLAQLAGRNGTPFAVVYDAGRPVVEYVDQNSEWAALHSSLIARFPGQLLVFSDFTRDEQKVLFHVYSDRNPGAYYQFDRKTNEIMLLVESEPWIKPEQLAKMQPIEFNAKDGTRLYGFYTANGPGPKPLVVMPHGGPIGPYDNWGYDSHVQYLASRGYAVLQVNYRGSGGRGYNFEHDGWAQWGGLIQDDIADGVRWAIAQGKADPARVCIFGASFGGYSALMNPIRNPGMYKCAVGYAGVYDLNLMSKTDWSVYSQSGRREFNRIVGSDPARRSEQSPANFAAKLDIPVFLIHGKQDQTARVDQYHAMDDALRAAGKKPQTMLVDGEGHGFYNPKNLADLYRRIDSFLQSSLGADAPAGGAN
jgi:dipeptidyl aminopeptidase/acylaminoacyl peptidase